MIEQDLTSSDESDRNRATTKVYNPEVTPWETIGNDILRIHRNTIRSKMSDDFIKALLQSQFTDLNNTIVLLFTSNEELAGYAFAGPSRKKTPETARVWEVAIDPQFRKQQGLFPTLLEGLKKALLEKGYSSAKIPIIAPSLVRIFKKRYGDNVVPLTAPNKLLINLK